MPNRFVSPASGRSGLIFARTASRTAFRFKVTNVSRFDAAERKGIQRAAALPTGLMLIDMRGVKRLGDERFYYEWTDKTASAKASTEDVTFSRDLSLNGIKMYCNWDSWAGHWKSIRVAKPAVIHVDHIRDEAHAQNPGLILEIVTLYEVS